MKGALVLLVACGARTDLDAPRSDASRCGPRPAGNSSDLGVGLNDPTQAFGDHNGAFAVTVSLQPSCP